MDDDITPREWRRLSGLLDEMLELPADLRACRLQAIGAREPALKERMMALLAALDRAGDFLESQALNRLREKAARRAAVLPEKEERS
ncbi:MAG TPA: hypothetical protein VGR67_15415 [Candidatus Polarisedimenticolia bacterium]|jgi:hypothetical protein|nr:hypothetical protein [Candidatus Polarisedimenticolia bacterium]